MDTILKQVLKRITPSETEKHKTQGFIQNVIRVSGKLLEPRGLEQVLAGSYMRDTWMKDKKEFDLFIMFPEDTSREMLEKQGVEMGKMIVKVLKGRYEIAYAEHPYVRSVVGEYQIDIVPCYKLESAEKIKSAVDRTPFHNRWLARNLEAKLVGDVRLFKQFVKSLEIYGSDTKTSGLSGYLCELLVIHHGSFKNLMQSIFMWQAGAVFIDIHGERSYDSLDKELKNTFSKHPLVVIDPVDKNRNVAAAFSYESFMKLVYHAGYFLKKPSASYFSIAKSKPDIQHLKKTISTRETHIFAITFKRPEIIDDILWPQLRKTAKRIANIMEDAEFGVMNYDSFADDKTCMILLELPIVKLPSIRKIKGPPVTIQDRSAEFINKYKTSRLWIENDYWIAEAKRKFMHAKDKLRHSLSVPEKRLVEKGIGSYVSKSVAKKYTITSEKEVLSKARKNAELAEFLKIFFEKKVVK
ncbi:MAG: CCA tRNA nucleotidyltransferase [Candidatus Aenigmatarchaeota archaeon]|nr:CCA tRNA nucleotidyltransferase [Nanoarchaeota archaeon]